MLSEAGLTIKPVKCQFAMAECIPTWVTLLEVVWDRNLQAVKQFPVPNTKKQETSEEFFGPNRLLLLSHTTLCINCSTTDQFDQKISSQSSEVGQ